MSTPWNWLSPRHLPQKIFSIKENGKRYLNLGLQGRQVLKNLMNDREMVIKLTHKWNAVVIWEKNDCILQAWKQLSDNNI